MSSVLRKVRNVFRGGHHDDNSDSNNTKIDEGESDGERRTSLGKLHVTDDEREKLKAAGYTEDGSDKRGLAGHGATGTFEVLNPNATAAEHPNAMGNQSDYDRPSHPHQFNVTDSERDQLKSLGYTEEGADRRGVAGAGVTGTRIALQDSQAAYDHRNHQHKRTSTISSSNARPISKHESYTSQYSHEQEYATPRHSYIDTNHQSSTTKVSEADIHPAFRNLTRSYREGTAQEVYGRPERQSYIQTESSPTGPNAKYVSEQQYQHHQSPSDILTTNNNTATSAQVPTTGVVAAAANEPKSPNQSPRPHRDLERKPGYESLIQNQTHSDSDNKPTTTHSRSDLPIPASAPAPAPVTTTLPMEDAKDQAPYKVVHRCKECNQDDDITHYFAKDAIYRADL